MSLWKGQVADSRNIVVQDDHDDDWDTDADFVVSSTKSYHNCNLHRDMDVTKLSTNCFSAIF